MMVKPSTDRRPVNRAQMVMMFLALTAGIAAGLSIFTSASAAIALLKTATSGLFLPLLLSLIASFLLEPAVRTLEGGWVSRTGSIFIVFALVSLLGFGIILWATPHWEQMLLSLKADIPRYTAGLVAFVKDLQLTVHSRIPLLSTMDFAEKARPFAEEVIAGILMATPKSALRIGSLMVLVPLFSFFFLRDGRRIMRALIQLTPNRYFEMAHDLSYLISNQLAQFIRGRIIEALIIGIVVTVGLSFTDIRYAAFLGAFAGVTNLIPYVGPLIGMIPGILIALVDLGVGGQFWWIVIVYVLIAQVLVDNFILIPILISRVSNLHPLLVILAIIMGGKLYGVLGMIIGVPVASIIKISILEIQNYRRAFALPDMASESERLP